MSEPPEAKPDAAASTRRAFRIDAIASGFVGALALAVSTYNVYLQREQIRAQVWPHLEWSYSDPGDGAFEWNLENTGVGPARIRAVRMTVDGKPAKDWEDAFVLFAGTDPARRKVLDAMHAHSLYSTIAGRVVGAGVMVHPLRLPGIDNDVREPLRAAYESVSVEICYCSTLDECWMAPGSKPVRACPTEGYVVTAQ